MLPLPRVTQHTPRSSRPRKCPKSTQPSSTKTISPLWTPAHSSRARLLSCSPAVSMITKLGRKLCRLSRIWVLAAALRRRCLAQSRQLATNSSTVVSTTWMGILKRKAGPRCRRAANARQRSRVQLEGITQVIQANTMGQLCIAQAHHMAPRRERARLILRPGGPRNFGDQVLGNKIANLLQDAELGAGWGYFEFIHPCRVAGARKKFQPIFSNPLGRL